MRGELVECRARRWPLAQIASTTRSTQTVRFACSNGTASPDREQLLRFARMMGAGPRLRETWSSKPDRLPPFLNDPATRTWAFWTAQQLVALPPRDVLDVLWRNHLGGASWAELAAVRRVSACALQHRAHRALVNARRRTAIGRVV